MFRIEGDGSYQHTVVWKDGEQISYDDCMFRINRDECIADIDGEEGHLDYMVLSGVYVIISGGDFINSKIMIFDEVLRGVQSLSGHISSHAHPIIGIEAILLPNIVEDAE